MITLHHLSQSRSLRILWLMEELSLPYEVIRYERDAQTHLAPPELLAVHPLGKSPVIEIKGQRLAESGAIVEYICGQYGPEFLPAPQSPEYFQHLELMHFAEGSAMTPLLLKIYVGLLGEAGAPLHPRIQSELQSHFQFMQDSLRPSGHFVLDQLSAADIMLSFPISALARLGMAEDFPKLWAFHQAIAERPAYQRAVQAGGGD